MISVVIPTYKEPEALDLCLRSAVKGQKNKNQIIVVVDGFYNINKEVLDKYKDDIEVLNLEDNVGLSRGTNLGVYNAKYDKVLIVNDDNVFPYEWDVRLETAFQSNSVISPNQIEPMPSMFKQFVIDDMGKDISSFDLETFWQSEHLYSGDKIEETGSTLPIFMSKLDYLRVGGWDENYENGMVADWDFFLKCKLSGLKMLRTYNANFYHFASVSVNNEKRYIAEQNGHSYANYKWGTLIKHNPINNDKYL